MPENVHSRTIQLRNALQDYWVSNNPSLVDLANQGVDLETAYYLAQEYYPVNLAFPRLLAAAISQVTDEDARLHLVT
jgi:pyrroloquinoline quinone (PQQ) biosynthesis protein C